jgi:ferrous iron transport protein B
LPDLPAKEIVVSTMGVLYQSNDEESTVNLQNRLQNEVHPTGAPGRRKGIYHSGALAFLVFILLYFPCVGVIATLKTKPNRGNGLHLLFFTLQAWHGLWHLLFII